MCWLVACESDSTAVLCRYIFLIAAGSSTCQGPGELCHFFIIDFCDAQHYCLDVEHNSTKDGSEVRQFALQEEHVPPPSAVQELQQHLWPASTRVDTSLAHSSASDSFRLKRRQLLASSQTLVQAEEGKDIIECRPVGFNIDGDDFAAFSSARTPTNSAQANAHSYFRLSHELFNSCQET